jgi:hypothetical protein
VTYHQPHAVHPGDVFFYDQGEKSVMLDNPTEPLNMVKVDSGDSLTVTSVFSDNYVIALTNTKRFVLVKAYWLQLCCTSLREGL